MMKVEEGKTERGWQANMVLARRSNQIKSSSLCETN
jgi:hypothetical protein